MGGEFFSAEGYAAFFRQIGLDQETVFTDPRIHVWRSLQDRENARLDVQRDDGRSIRFHIKRYPVKFGATAAREMAAFRLVQRSNVPAAPIVAHGRRGDGSSFIVLEDLAGFSPADKLLQQGLAFDRLLNATADLAALLHRKGLHHRDLYLCHFMIKPMDDCVDAKLIDLARIGTLYLPVIRHRWIVKDLAQFWYSTLDLPVTSQQREQWLMRYCQSRQIKTHGLRAAIERKAAAISRHDRQLRRKQPDRNVSID